MSKREDHKLAITGAVEPFNVTRWIQRSARKADHLVVFSDKEPNSDPALLRRNIIDISQSLILIEGARLCESRKTAAGKRPRGVNRLRRRNQKAAIGQFEIQQSQGHGVDVRSIRIDRDTPQCAFQATE